ncbi:MAG: 2-octaprenyl-6-methoxyphenyl hydroxylase [Thiotrichales bacterium]
MDNRTDIAIVGQGLVGSILAIGLAQRGYAVALIESRRPSASTAGHYDERSLALGYKSRQILEGLKLWGEIDSDATAIKRIHISERGRLGSTRLNAEDFGVCEMGHVATLNHLAQTLERELAAYTGITRYSGFQLQKIHRDCATNTLTLEHNGEALTLQTNLLIGADGTTSATRELLGIRQTRYDFAQSAIVANVTPERPHQNEAFERFTPEGPIALLPLSEQRCALVWTRTPEKAEETLSLDNEAFLHSLNKAFGHRLGRFTKTGRRDLFPLSMALPERLTSNRSLLIGNAAHTLHPVAGQGLNLALRDVAVLLDILDRGYEPGSSEQLLTYETLRMRDIKETARYTYTLVKIFSNSSPLLSHTRAASLGLLDKLPPIKKQIAKIGMGKRGYLHAALLHGQAGGSHLDSSI